MSKGCHPHQQLIVGSPDPVRMRSCKQSRGGATTTGGALPDGLHVGEEGVKGDQVIACVLELACHHPHAPGRIIVLPHSLGAQNMMV